MVRRGLTEIRKAGIHHTMRAVTLLLCLALAACAGRTAETGGASQAAAAPAAAAAPSPAPGAASAPAAGPASAAAPARSGPPDVLQVQDARVECWGKVEKQRNLRSIDARIAFVDKCVADATGRR